MGIVYTQALETFAPLLGSGYQPLWTTAQLSDLVRAGSPSIWPSPVAGLLSPFILLATILVVWHNASLWAIENVLLPCIIRMRQREEPGPEKRRPGPTPLFVLWPRVSPSVPSFDLHFSPLKKRLYHTRSAALEDLVGLLPPLLPSFPSSLSSHLSVLWPWINRTPQIMSHCHPRWSRHRSLLFYLFSDFSPTSLIPTPCFSPHPTSRSGTYSNVYSLKGIWCVLCFIWCMAYMCF